MFVAMREMEIKTKLLLPGFSLLLEQVCLSWALLISLSFL